CSYDPAWLIVYTNIRDRPAVFVTKTSRLFAASTFEHTGPCRQGLGSKPGNRADNCPQACWRSKPCSHPKLGQGGLGAPHLLIVPSPKRRVLPSDCCRVSKQR